MKIQFIFADGSDQWRDLSDDVVGERIEMPILDGTIASRIFELSERKSDHVIYRETQAIEFSPSELKARARRSPQSLDLCDNSIDTDLPTHKHRVSHG